MPLVGTSGIGSKGSKDESDEAHSASAASIVAPIDDESIEDDESIDELIELEPAVSPPRKRAVTWRISSSETNWW